MYICMARHLVLVRPDCKIQSICFVMPFWPKEILVLLRSFCSSLHNNVNRVDKVKEYKKKKAIFSWWENWKRREMGRWVFPEVGLSAAKEKPRGLVPNRRNCVTFIASHWIVPFTSDSLY